MPSAAQLVVIGPMCARLPDRPTLIVGGCSQSTRAARPAFARVVDQPALELLGVLEIDQAEQVDFERWGNRGMASLQLIPPIHLTQFALWNASRTHHPC